MAWSNNMPKQEGRYWVKLPQFSYLVIGGIYKVNDIFKLFMGGNYYREEDIPEALFWSEPVIEPPMPE